jgi:hypothetical protein
MKKAASSGPGWRRAGGDHHAEMPHRVFGIETMVSELASGVRFVLPLAVTAAKCTSFS